MIFFQNAFLFLKKTVKDAKRSLPRFFSLLIVAFLISFICFPALFSLASQKISEKNIIKNSKTYDYKIELPEEVYLKGSDSRSRYDLQEKINNFLADPRFSKHRENWDVGLRNHAEIIEENHTLLVIPDYLNFPADKLVLYEKNPNFSWEEASENYVVINPGFASANGYEIGDTIRVFGEDRIIYGFGGTASTMFFSLNQTKNIIFTKKNPKNASSRFTYVYVKRSLWNKKKSAYLKNFKNELLLKRKNSSVGRKESEDFRKDLETFFANDGKKLSLKTKEFYKDLEAGFFTLFTDLKIAILVCAFILVLFAIIFVYLLYVKSIFKREKIAIHNFLFNSQNPGAFLIGVLLFDFFALLLGFVLGYLIVFFNPVKIINRLWSNNLKIERDFFFIYFFLFLLILISFLSLVFFFIISFKTKKILVQKKISQNLKLLGDGIGTRIFFSLRLRLGLTQDRTNTLNFFSGKSNFFKNWFFILSSSFFIFLLLFLNTIFINLTGSNNFFLNDESRNVNFLKDSLYVTKGRTGKKKINSYVSFKEIEPGTRQEYYRFNEGHEPFESDFGGDLLSKLLSNKNYIKLDKALGFNRTIPQFLTALKKQSENYGIDSVSFSEITYQESDNLGLRIDFQADQATGFILFFEDLEKNKNLFRFEVQNSSDQRGKVYLSSFFKKKYKVGDSISLILSWNKEMIAEVEYEVAGFFDSEYSLFPIIVADYSSIRSHVLTGVNNRKGVYNIISFENSDQERERSLIVNLALTNKNLRDSGVIPSETSGANIDISSPEKIKDLVVFSSVGDFQIKDFNNFVSRYFASEKNFAITNIVFFLFVFLIFFIAFILTSFGKFWKKYKIGLSLGYSFKKGFTSFLSFKSFCLIVTLGLNFLFFYLFHRFLTGEVLPPGADISFFPAFFLQLAFSFLILFLLIFINFFLYYRKTRFRRKNKIFSSF